MRTQRKTYSAEFKAKVALDAIRCQKTINELALKYEVHPNQIAQWKKLALDSLPQLFTDKRAKADKDEEELKAHLFQEIGQLKFELDWLKKKAGVFD